MCGKPLAQARGADPLVGKTIAGHRLIRRIGAGAMAVVYEGERLNGGGRFAIKMLTGEAAKDEENGRRFTREAKLCREIAHPNVVAVHDCGCENGVYFMIMELVEGATMESVIDKQGALPWRQVSHLVLQVAQAADHISKLGIIHRDIKPANILLTKGGVAKLVDLGFAKKLDDHDSDLMSGNIGDLTMQGVSMGSPAYMPPEQVLDAKQATQTADVYSLGATFFHAIIGKTPFNGKTAYDIMEKVLRDPIPVPRELNPDIPVAISQLIEWTMEKRPERRPQTAGEFVRELEIAIFAPEDGKRIRRLRRSQSKAWLLPVVVGTAAVVVLGLLGFLLILRKH
jgi:serine/threonine protein kinase